MWKLLRKIFGNVGSSQRVSGQKILIIEDGEIERRVMRKILEEAGYYVLTAVDGQGGIDVCRDENPDMICLDIGLPDMAGTEVCKRLKSDPGTEPIPVLFLTGQDSPNRVIDSYEVGAEGYLAKPVDARTLVRNVDQILRDISVSSSS